MPGLDMMPRPDDREAAMARADLYKLANYSMKLFKMIQDGDQLEGWVQAKITKSADYIASVYHFMEYEMKFSEYGERLETADMYSESVKREFKRKLTEAKVKLEKLKEKNQKDLDEGWEDMMAANKKAASEKGTGKFDVKKTSTGTQYTRKSSTFTDGGDDSDTKKAKKKIKANENAPLTPAQGAALMKSKDPNAYNKMKGIKTPAKTTMAVSDPEGVPAKPGTTKPVKEGSKPDFLDMDKDGNKKEPMKKAVADKKKTTEALKGGQKKLDVDKDGKLEKSDFAKLRSNKGVKEAAKPDFLDMDKDGNKKEPMKKAVADKKKNPFAKK